MKRNLVALFFILSFAACGPYIWFKTPQPVGRDNKSSFPKEFIGTYTSIWDTSTIRIESKKIVREYRESLIMSKEDFKKETGDSISCDTSFTLDDNWDIVVKSLNDSVEIFTSKDDDLFTIAEKHILREYKGYYFLNFQDSNDYWKVKILKIYKDTLEFDYILKDEDIKIIKRITTIESYPDSTGENVKHYLNPTKRELRKILKKRMAGEKFIKTN